ncbi:cytochrome P450 [Sphaerimonospora mesophila]|uniref:cytochrome P450 n=1 Tax=Sphaerimonospora mesophila TaxID=37483 RepID=UPI0019103F59
MKISSNRQRGRVSDGRAPTFRDTVIGGFPIRVGQNTVVLLPALHRHPKAWDRPEEFDIDTGSPRTGRGITRPRTSRRQR